MTAALAAANDQHPPANLVEKLAAVMAQVERVPKNGRNAFHNYNYATEADITDAVRSAMARWGVMLIPSIDKVDWGEVETKGGSKEKLCTLTVRFRVTDGKEHEDFMVIGQGQDRGDKSAYKAMTGATKYALLKLFLIPTGDDPETEGDEKPHRGPAPRQQRAASHVAAAAEVLGAKVEPSMAEKVRAIWDKAGEVWEGEERDRHWRLAVAAVFKAPQAPKSADWTEEQAKAFDKALFPAGGGPDDDIPFAPYTAP